MDEVQLGFAQEVPDDEAVLFEISDWSQWDGGIAGGDGPILLARDHVPDADWAVCECCGHKMSFLAQIYAPLDEPEGAFHRCIYVLVCRYCGQGSKAFRSQLPRKNCYYHSESAKSKTPSQIQLFHLGPSLSKRRYEIVVETEPPALTKNDQTFIPTEISASNQDDAKFNQYDMNQISGAAPPPDALTLRFLARCSREPAQVLRYQRGGQPLLISASLLNDRVQDELINRYDEEEEEEEEEGRVKKRHEEHDPAQHSFGIQPPPCPYCSAPRIFEFQLLPQLLHALRVDAKGNDSRNLNFGAIYIFTCSKSCCVHNNSYLAEFSLLQPPLDNHPRLVVHRGSGATPLAGTI